MKSKTYEFSFVNHYQSHVIIKDVLFPFKTFQQQFKLMSTSTNEFVPFV